METTTRNVAIKYAAFSGVWFALLIWRRVSRHVDLDPRDLGFIAAILVISAVLAWRYEMRKGAGFDWFTSFLVSMSSTIVTTAVAVGVGFGVLFVIGRLS